MEDATESPSMRREWIEISCQLDGSLAGFRSPSMRREWIEIPADRRYCGGKGSLPPCGGSGLKYRRTHRFFHRICLPPCGGSGLKFRRDRITMREISSPSMRREWIEITFPEMDTSRESCLPPCGGSGLKSLAPASQNDSNSVSLHAEGVD